MKNASSILTLFCCFLACNSASAQPLAIQYDSLLHQLAVQKTAGDSMTVLLALSADKYFYYANWPEHTKKMIDLNNKQNRIDPLPYQLTLKGMAYEQKKQFDSALTILQVAVHEFDKQHKTISNLLSYIRIFYNALNDREGRLRFYEEKLEYYTVNGPAENIASCYHGIAGYYVYQASYNQAISYYLKAAEMSKNFDSRFYTNEICVVGSMYRRWGNAERAEYYLKKIAIPMTINNRDTQNIGYCYYNLSKSSDEKHNYEQALKEIDQALLFTDSSKFLEFYLSCSVTKGLIYMDMGKSNLALPIFIKAKQMADSGDYRLSNLGGELEIDYAFYRYYRETGDNAKAEKYLLAANQKAEEEQVNNVYLIYLKELAEFYENIQKPLLALENYHRYFALLDSIDRGQGKFKVAQYEIDQKNKQQEEHINELKREKMLQEYQISRRNALLWVSLAVLLLISGLLFFINRQLRINKKNLAVLRNTQQQLVQSEKLASLGELTAGIAHEIQNPLNFVNNFSEVSRELLDEMKEKLAKCNYEDVNAIADDVIINLQKINHHGKRADAIVKGMLQHSRNSNAIKEPTNINKLADEFLRLAYHGLRAKDKSFNAILKTDFDETIVKINIIPQDIGRVILNLITNAFYAVDEKRKQGINGYEPTVFVSTTKQANTVLITVKDNGNGIPQKVLDKIFQPFFTTKPSGQGTGLGLSLSYDIVKVHGGKMSVETEEGEGSEFYIQLPI